MDAKKNNLNNIYEWLESIIFAVVLLVLFFAFVVRIVSVRGSSMVPTLSDNDKVTVAGTFYEPERGDVIVISYGRESYHQTLVKRVIALGGDELHIDGNTGEVFLNGQRLEEDYIAEKIAPSDNAELTVTVPEGYIFVMGDNRNHSSDSRSTATGFIDVELVAGKVGVHLFPLSGFGKIE